MSLVIRKRNLDKDEQDRKPPAKKKTLEGTERKKSTKSGEGAPDVFSIDLVATTIFGFFGYQGTIRYIENQQIFAHFDSPRACCSLGSLPWRPRETVHGEACETDPGQKDLDPLSFALVTNMQWEAM